MAVADAPGADRCQDLRPGEAFLRSQRSAARAHGLPRDSRRQPMESVAPDGSRLFASRPLSLSVSLLFVFVFLLSLSPPSFVCLSSALPCFASDVVNDLRTCGCARADSGLYTDNGCRQACQKEAVFQTSVNQSGCHDFGSDEVQRRQLWTHWWSGFYNNSFGLWLDDNFMMTFARDGAQGNCSFISSAEWIPGVVCKHHPSISRPASLLCPETCGCTAAASPGGYWCPSNCSARTA